jgi:hypothetical protein
MTRLLLVLELALVVGALALVVGHAAAVNVHPSRRAGALGAASRALTVALDAESFEGATEEVRALRRTEQVRLLTSFSTALDGDKRERLRHIAEQVGVLTLAARRCRSRLWWRRLEGARLFTVLGGGQRKMLRLLDDRREEVRAQAMEWAGAYASPQAVERLADHLSDPASLCRFTVKESLLRLRAQASPVIRRRLAAQQGALADLLEVAAWSAVPSYLEPALALTRSADPAVRTGAVRLLGALGGPRAVERLREALDDHTPQVRAAAAEATGRLGHWPAAPLLGARLRDSAWDVRKEAALALARVGAPGQVVLRRALSDADPFAADMARLMLALPPEPARGAP